LSNLLGNAEKFTPPGGRVVVTATGDAGKAVVRVRDNGAGIAPDVLPHLFEPFAQAPQTIDRARGGLGLGLSMVKSLIDLHGGTVDITSPGPGQGTVLTIVLPLARAQPPAAKRAPAADACSRRVLVIEDNEDAADTLKHVLSMIGHDVQVAYDGPTGLELARSFHPEVVFCDIGLPGMDGYEVARAFRREVDSREAYIVALTGYARPEDRQRAVDAGFDEHVAKPPSAAKLNRVLSAVPLRQLH
jgi:two-component system CheB/CheR fusion protein